MKAISLPCTRPFLAPSPHICRPSSILTLSLSRIPIVQFMFISHTYIHSYIHIHTYIHGNGLINQHQGLCVDFDGVSTTPTTSCSLISTRSNRSSSSLVLSFLSLSLFCFALCNFFFQNSLSKEKKKKRQIQGRWLICQSHQSVNQRRPIINQIFIKAKAKIQ